MLKLIAIVVVVAAAAADLEVDWAVFKAKYNKKYNTVLEEIRKNIWIENQKYVEAHNKLYSQGRSSFYLGENEYSDMTNTEFSAKMKGLRPQPNNKVMSSVRVDTTSLPATVDWRDKGFVTPVKNQGQCGSCWAFSTVGAVEGQHFNATGQLVSLSESNLVDCTFSYGEHGCKGGWTSKAYEYIIKNKGIDTEAGYPYVPKDESCTFSRSDIGATISSYRDIPVGSESALQKATAEVGPISVCIDATHASFQLYRGGVYDEFRCSSKQLDHCVLVVGYGTYQSTPYWMVKNSWGTNWGMEGYIMMIRNHDNNCGIATQATYPIV